MIEIKQTETYRKWEKNLKDRKAKAIIAARIFRLSSGIFGDVATVCRSLLSNVYLKYCIHKENLQSAKGKMNAWTQIQ